MKYERNNNVIKFHSHCFRNSSDLITKFFNLGCFVASTAFGNRYVDFRTILAVRLFFIGFLSIAGTFYSVKEFHEDVRLNPVDALELLAYSSKEGKVFGPVGVIDELRDLVVVLVLLVQVNVDVDLDFI